MPKVSFPMGVTIFRMNLCAGVQEELAELHEAFDLVADGAVVCSRVSDDGLRPSWLYFLFA